MSFNAAKCNSITISRKKKKIDYNYTLHNHILEKTDKTTYLGVELANDLTWSAHITKTCAKANRNLSFIRRNLRIKNQDIKEIAFKGLVRPVLEYCSTVWSPHQIKYIDMLEMVQRRAARYVLCRYHNESSVTKMMKGMGWDTLACRRTRADATMFYKIEHSLVAVPMPASVQRPERLLRNPPHYYRPLYCSTVSFQNSFFPRTVKIWNKIPDYIAAEASLPSFKAALSQIHY